MSIANGMARVNRAVTNPVMRLWAGRIPPLAIIEHRGRRTGKTYRTPVMAFRRDDSVTIFLPYGTDRDWVRNVQAGSAAMVRNGRRVALRQPSLTRVGPLDALRLHIGGDRG